MSYKSTRIKRLLESESFNNNYSFENFERDRDPNAFDVASHFAQNQAYTGQVRSGLYMLGQTGVGKTHLAVSIIRVLENRYHQGIPVKLGIRLKPWQKDAGHKSEVVSYRPFTTCALSMPEFWSKIKAAKSFSAEFTQDELIHTVATTSCVLFDDMDRGIYHYDQLDVLFKIFTLRFSKPGITLITTNRTFPEFTDMLYDIDSQYAEAIISRIKGCITGKIVFVERDDYRGVCHE